MGRVGAIPDAVPTLPFADGVDGDVVASGQFNLRARRISARMAGVVRACLWSLTIILTGP